MRPVFAVFVSLLPFVASHAAFAAEAIDPAHALAQKFAQDAPKPAAKPQAAPAFKVAPKPGADYEKELLDAARAEAEAAAPKPAATPPPAVSQPAEAPATAAAPAPPPAPPAPAPAHPAPVQKAEAKPEPATPASGAPGQGTSVANSSGTPAHVTMLLVLTSPAAEAAATSGKVQSNPIVCIGETCYLSAGSVNSAKAMARTAAMDAKNTALGLDGACQGRTSCIFRNVTLPPGESLQVVDAGYARAEPFAAIEAQPDQTCAIQEEDLDCDHTVLAKDYRLWLVPEHVAGQAKAAQIEDALSTGLVEDNVIEADDK